MGPSPNGSSKVTLLHLSAELELWAERNGRKKSEGYTKNIRYCADPGPNQKLVGMFPNSTRLQDISKEQNRPSGGVVFMRTEEMGPYIRRHKMREAQQDGALATAISAMQSTQYQEMQCASQFPTRGPRGNNWYRNCVRDETLWNRLQTTWKTVIECYRM